MGLKDQKEDDTSFGALPEFEAVDPLSSTDDIEVQIVEEDVGTEDGGEDGDGADDESADDGDGLGAEDGSEAGDASDGDSEGEGESEDDVPNDAEYLSYSKNVRKRIDREVKLRKKEVGQIRDQLQNVQQQSVQQIQALTQREQVAQQSLHQMQENYITLLEDSITKDIATKQKELRAAKDEGDSEKEVAAMSDLQGLMYQKNQAAELKQQVAARKSAPPVPSAPAAPANPLAQRWLDKNKEIFTNKKFRHKAVAIRVIDNDMASEGWSPHTEAYYKELDRRIDEEFPGLRKKPPSKGNGKPQGGGKPAGSPVAAVGSGGGGQSQGGKNVVRLTKADLINMQKYGMDPTNKEHLKTYARQKLTA